MTAKQLFASMDKPVVINEQGKQAFSDNEGTFYLVGIKKEMLTLNGKRQAVYCGIIARTLANRKSRSINAAYLDIAHNV